MIVARIRPLSLAKVIGAIFAILIGAGVLIGAPVFSGALGFLAGLFTVAVYNAAARALGGVELEVLER